MDESVENRIREGGVTERLMPMTDWKLAGDDDRAQLDPVLDNLE